MMTGLGKEYGFIYVEFIHAAAIYPAQSDVTAQNGEQPIRLPNDLLYP